MSEKAKEILQRARTRLITEDCPYWGVLCMGMDLIEDGEGKKSLGSMATDGKAIYYFSPFIESHTVPEVEFFLAHESGGHKGLLHHIRLREMGEGVDLKTFNIAADYVANLILAEAHIGKMPSSVLYDTKFANKNVEQVYRILMDEKQKAQPQEKQEEKGEKEKSEEEPSGPQSQEQIGDKDPGQCGGVLPAPETQEVDIKEAEEEAKSEIRKAFQTAQKAGHIPEGLRELIEELLEPKIDWRSLLRQFVEERAKNDYSWSRPNKRYLPSGLYMPQLDSRELGQVLLLIDVSGSVSNDQAQALLSEGMGLLEEYPDSTLQVIFFATRASDPIEITDANQIKTIKKINVGYGTDYKPPFDKIREKELSPIVVIVLTDGYCSSFPEFIDAPVIWIINNKDKFRPPFGDTVRMIE